MNEGGAAEIERFKEKNQKYNRRFNKLLSREIVPLVAAAIALIGAFQFRTQIENLLFANGRLGMQALS